MFFLLSGGFQMESSEFGKQGKKQEKTGKNDNLSPDDTATVSMEETVFLSKKDLYPSGTALDDDIDYEIPVLKNFRLSLQIVSGKDKGKSFEVSKTRITIGRGGSDFNFKDSMASRKHASIELLPNGHISLNDLASTNGTMLNGKDISSKLLKDGDMITIGKTDLKVTIVTL